MKLIRKVLLPAVALFVTFACGTHPKEKPGTRFVVTEETTEDSVHVNQSNQDGQPTTSDVHSDDTVFVPDNVQISYEELKMYNMLMYYRTNNGLSQLHLSKSLTFVAQQHCKDLYHHQPDKETNCNAHSWSDKGNWTSCCYTADHKQSNCMWNKPAELTGYSGYGFEIACGSSKGFSDYEMTAEYAVASWKESTGHNNVILNRDVWKDFPWTTVGVGLYKGFACVWFGQAEDPAGYLKMDE